MNNFKVSDKVVCVKRGAWVGTRDKRQRAHGPIYGCVYRIQKIEPDFDSVYLRFAEFANRSFRYDRFRPAVERGTETGMTILRKILTEKKVEA